MIQVFRNFDRPNSVTKLYSNIHNDILKSYSVIQLIAPKSNAGFCNKLKNIFWLLKTPGELFHLTGDNSYFAWALIITGRPYLVTILDMGMPGRRSWLKKLIFDPCYFLIPLIFAKRIVCISDYTKTELCKKYKELNRKTDVIHVAVSEYFTNTRNLVEKDEQCDDVVYVLQIATSNHNKNVGRSIEAIYGTGYHYIFVGDLSIEYSSQLDYLNIPYSHYKDIDEEQLLTLYDKATILLFPSLYEGFGMPIIEAQSRGVSVITSNIPPMNDISGDAAILIDPYSVNDIRSALLRVGSDLNLRLDLRKKGLENVNRFLPELIARKHVNLYKWMKKMY